MPVARCATRITDEGVETLVVTAIDRDGLLEGPDLDLLERLVGLDRGRIIASGGISSIDDVLAARRIGCAGAIVGRALYEGRLDLRASTLAEALAEREPGLSALSGPRPRPPCGAGSIDLLGDVGRDLLVVIDLGVERRPARGSASAARSRS